MWQISTERRYLILIQLADSKHLLCGRHCAGFWATMRKWLCVCCWLFYTRFLKNWNTIVLQWKKLTVGFYCTIKWISCRYTYGPSLLNLPPTPIPPLSVQFSSHSQSCPTLCNLMDCSTLASLSITNSWSLLSLLSTESVMPSNHLILYRLLLLTSRHFLQFSSV